MTCRASALRFRRTRSPRSAVARLAGEQVAQPVQASRNANRESRAEVIVSYERHLCDSGLIIQVHELRGYDLVCWCAPEPCHGDLLLRLANEQDSLQRMENKHEGNS